MSTANATKQYCPYCHIIKGENKLVNYFIKNNIIFESQKTFYGLVGVKNRSLKYDFYLPDYNMLIEYQGEQHERPVERFGGEEQFKIQLEHDKRKREYAFSNNIELLEIWYYDFKNIDNILNEKLQKNA